MEQPRPHSTRNPNDNVGNGESLADYVKRMETEENLQKLAQKLESDLKNPGRPTMDTPDVSTPDVSTPDLSFGKFEEKRKRRSGQ